MRPENDEARSYLVGFREIRAWNARIVHEAGTLTPPRRVSPTRATGCGADSGASG